MSEDFSYDPNARAKAEALQRELDIEQAQAKWEREAKELAAKAKEQGDIERRQTERQVHVRTSHSESIQFDDSGGPAKIVTHENRQFNTVDLRSHSAGILATARGPDGSPTLRLSPESTVEIEGIRTSIRNAVNLGYLREIGPGQYAEAQAPSSNPKPAKDGQPQQPEVKAEAQAAEQPEVMPELPPEVAQVVLDACAEGGQSLDAMVDAEIAVSGLEGEAAEVAHGQMGTVIEDGLAVLADELAKQGVDARAALQVVEYLEDHPRRMEAVMTFALARDPSLLRELVNEWIAHSGTRRDRGALPAGVEVVGFDGLGDRIVRLKDGTVSSERGLRMVGRL